MRLVQWKGVLVVGVGDVEGSGAEAAEGGEAALVVVGGDVAGLVEGEAEVVGEEVE
jgi:hypothetical protein